MAGPQTGRQLTPQTKKYLHRKYHDLKFDGSFTGPQKFYRAIKRDGKYNIDLKTIAEFLQSQETYSVHKGVIHNFKRRPVVTAGINDLVESDLVYMQDYKKYNKQYAYLILFIDDFSRMAYGYPLRSKKPEEIIKNH